MSRCHTFPHHGTYSVAEHSYNMVAMLLVLHPSPSMDLVRACMFHDTAERWVGDSPGPGKAQSPSLRAELHALEAEALAACELSTPELSDDDQAWVTALDQLEFLFWCRDQENLGNRHAAYKASAVRAFMCGMERLPRPVAEILFLAKGQRLCDRWPWTRRMEQ